MTSGKTRILLADDHLKSFALEYLEQVLPAEIRRRLWVFIGDVSEHKRRRSLRSLDRVVSDLMGSHATLFAGAEEQDALRRLLKEEGLAGEAHAEQEPEKGSAREANEQS